MANHVYFNVTVDGNNECLKGFSSAMEMTSVERKNWTGEGTMIVRELLDIDKLKFMPEGTYDKDGYLEDSWNYYVNNVGAKWCNVEDVEEYHFSGYSAWSAPLEFVQYLHEYLYDHHDKNHSIKMTYEDEFRNFIGVAHYKDGSYDIDELESGDLMEELRKVFGDVVDNEDFWDGEYEQGDPSEEMDNIVWEWFENN
jgi:hypothetical protein